MPFELPLVEAAIAGDTELAAASGYEVAPGWATFRGALKATRDALATDPAGVAWGPRLFVSGEPATIVGWGGFKGPPARGVVELGYEIAESHRGRGLATAAARAMLAEAFGHDDVIAVIAHTEAQPNASNHILEKLGFRFHGDRVEEGTTVWRYRIDRGSPDGEL